MERACILIVDDEVNTRNGLFLTLDRHYKGQNEIITAEHGLIALEILKSRSVDLVISDIRMPGLDGLELVEAIDREGILTTVILLSGYAEFEYAQKGIRFGIHDYLLKPIDREKLIDAVERGLRHTRKILRRDLSLKLMEENLGGAATGTKAGGNAAISDALKYMEENFSEPLTIKEVAHFAHLSPSYFSVLFKDTVNMTFSDYLTRLRMTRAKELLLMTDCDISIIAEETGYQSASYFIRVFKEYEGMTPKHYRDTRGKR